MSLLNLSFTYSLHTSPVNKFEYSCIFTPIFRWIRVAQFLIFYVDHGLSFCSISFGHCIGCSSIYGFWLFLWYLRFTASDYSFGILDLRFLIIPLVSEIYCFWIFLWYLQIFHLISKIYKYTWYLWMSFKDK